MLWSKIFNIYCIFTFLVYGQSPRWSLIQVVSTLDVNVYWWNSTPFVSYPQLAILICYLHLSLSQTSVAISQLVFFINMFPQSSGLLALQEAAQRRLSPSVLPQDFEQLSVSSWKNDRTSIILTLVMVIPSLKYVLIILVPTSENINHTIC